MSNQRLHVFTARFNPIGWKVPHDHYKAWAEHMLDSGVDLTVAEVAYGETPFQCELPHVNHVGLRADSWAWSKENAINLAIQRRPDAKYICWEDADIHHRDPDWASKTVDALQHYRVVQPWSQALDLGPGNASVSAIHRSFADCYARGEPLVANGAKWWTFAGGPYAYPHTGFSWACKREFLDRTGGLFELGGMGSGDHHMGLAMVGKAERSLPGKESPSYRAAVMRWQSRAMEYLGGRLGAVHGTIEHKFHGSKDKRGYLSRWGMFGTHGFDPDTDLKRNTHGVLEWAGNKPELEREWDQYLRARREDDNCN